MGGRRIYGRRTLAGAARKGELGSGERGVR